MQTTRSEGAITPSSRSRLAPATLAALAGSQPSPPAPTLAFASMISWSETMVTTPLLNSRALRHFFKLTGRLISIADATVEALISLGVELPVIVVDLVSFPAGRSATAVRDGPPALPGPRARRIDDREPGHRGDQPR